MLIKKEPIALVGMSLRFPGDICDPADLWQSLLEKKD